MKTVLKIPVAAFSLFIFLVFLLLYLYFFTSVPEQQLNDWLGYYLPQKIGYKVEVAKVYRDIWKRLKLQDIDIYLVDNEKDIPIGHIESIDLEYSWEDILFKDYHFKDLIIKNADLSLVPIQKRKAKADSARVAQAIGKISFPGISVDNFRMENASLRVAEKDSLLDFIIPKLSGSFGTDDNIVDVNIDSLSGSCPQKDFNLNSFQCKAFMIGDELMFESIQFATDKSKVLVSGQYGKIDAPDYQLSFDFYPLDLEDITPWAGVKLQGEVNTRGHVEGNFEKFKGQIRGDAVLFDENLDDFDMDFHFDALTLFVDSYKGGIFKAPSQGKGFLNFATSPATYNFNGQVNNLDLENIGVNLYSSFTGHIDANGSGLSESNFRMGIDMNLTKADIDIYHFHKAIGSIEFDLKGLEFKPGFKANYKHTWVDYSGYLEYDGDLDILGKAEFADLSDFKNQIFVEDLDGVGQADFHASGPTLDFNVEGTFSSDSCRFYGLYADTFNLDLDLKSFVSHKVGYVSGEWHGGDLYSVPIDSGSFSVIVSGEKFFLDNVYCENANNKLRLAGDFDNGTIPPKLKIDTLNVVLWNDTVYNEGPLLIDVYPKEVEFNDFSLHSRSSRLQMAGTVTYEQQMDLVISAENVEIRPIVEYFIKDKEYSGMLSGNFALGGDFDLPEFTADIAISDFSIDHILLGYFNVRATYAASALNISLAELEGANSLFNLSGILPINLSFTYEGSRLPDTPMNLKLKAFGKSIALVPVFVKNVKDFKTDFNVDLSIAGTYSAPLVKGNFSAKKGVLDIYELENNLTDINITGHMFNDSIFVDSLSAYARLPKEGVFRKLNISSLLHGNHDERRGLITGSGAIKILGLGLFDYNLQLNGYNCEFYTAGYDIQFVVQDMGLKVTGSSPPLVSGYAKLDRLLMKESFESFYAGTSEEGAVIEDSTMWDIYLDVSATNNIWIKNTQSEAVLGLGGAADMEMDGNVVITREKGIYNVLGDLEVLRGNYFLGGIKFNINTGQMSFDNPDTLDPEINFDVTTKIRPSNQVVEYTDLNLVISGRLSKPHIGTATGSGYSDEDIILTLLEHGILANNVSVFGNLVANQLEDIEFISAWVDDIDINPEETSTTATGGEVQPSATQKNPATRITLMKYIFPQLIVTYSRRISLEEGASTVGFEYIVNKYLSLEGKQGGKGTIYEGVSFDAKLRYEF